MILKLLSACSSKYPIPHTTDGYWCVCLSHTAPCGVGKLAAHLNLKWPKLKKWVASLHLNIIVSKRSTCSSFDLSLCVIVHHNTSSVFSTHTNIKSWVKFKALLINLLSLWKLYYLLHKPCAIWNTFILKHHVKLQIQCWVVLWFLLITSSSEGFKFFFGNQATSGSSFLNFFGLANPSKGFWRLLKNKFAISWPKTNLEVARFFIKVSVFLLQVCQK